MGISREGVFDCFAGCRWSNQGDSLDVRLEEKLSEKIGLKDSDGLTKVILLLARNFTS